MEAFRKLKDFRPPPREVRQVEESLWPSALSAGKALATSLALIAFAGSITLDDLHLFRVPIIYVGTLTAALLYAFAPPVLAFRLLDRVAVDSPDAQAHAVEAALIWRKALFGVTVGGLLVWLVFFSAGRTIQW